MRQRGLLMRLQYYPQKPITWPVRPYYPQVDAFANLKHKVTCLLLVYGSVARVNRIIKPLFSYLILKYLYCIIRRYLVLVFWSSWFSNQVLLQ